MSRKNPPAGTTKVPRYEIQLRCNGETPDGVQVTKEAMKARVFRRKGASLRAVVVLYKGRGHGGAKGALAGVYYGIEELAALELAARMSRIALIDLLSQSAG